jgi:hypothetical protein
MAPPSAPRRSGPSNAERYAIEAPLFRPNDGSFGKQA